MECNKKQTIDVSKTQYSGNTETIFTLRNDFFMCPPFHLYKILDDYDTNNIVINETKFFYSDVMKEGAGHKQYHLISFRNNGTYEIRIQNLRTQEIQTYTFIIDAS